MNNAIVVVFIYACVVHVATHTAACQPEVDILSEQTSVSDPLEARFVYSISILKDLNEKILALDHHFTSLSAHHDVFNLSNPLNYPEFTSLQDYVESDLKEKHTLNVPGFLEQNAVFASAWTLVSLVLSDKSATEKSKALESISCLLDFTMRIQNDLNVIYYETDFLREANEELGLKCNALFNDHCRLIGYDTPLQSCREADDWENVFAHVNMKFQGMQSQSQVTGLLAKVTKEKNDLQFRIDLTVQFIQEYTGMISQGIKHYQKFQKILSKYEQEKACVGQLPAAFTQLKGDVQLTLEKFENAYQMPELFGSRLKMLMYGVQD